MDIDGVALVAGAGKANSREMPHLCLRTCLFAEMASTPCIQCVEENSTLISYLTGSGIGREVALPDPGFYWS